MSPEQRKELRGRESLPILHSFKKWIYNIIVSGEVLPKNPMSKAMNYCLKRWDKLIVYLHDGSLEIDNNLVENQIRPVALGRKNYLFAGSHEAAQRTAMIYTFFGICKAHKVNPRTWLRYVLENMMNTKITEIEKLFPQNFHKINPPVSLLEQRLNAAIRRPGFYSLAPFSPTLRLADKYLIDRVQNI